MKLMSVQKKFNWSYSGLNRGELFVIVIAALLSSFWLAGLVERWGPRSWTDWGLSAVITVPNKGYAQLFYDDGNGMSEERTLLHPVEAGRNTVFFSLPEQEMLAISSLRLDPLNSAGTFIIEDLELDGVFGLDLIDASRLRLKPGDGVTLEETETGDFTVTAATDDPAIRISWKSPPLTAPWFQLRLAGWLLLVVGLVPMAYLASSFISNQNWMRFAWTSIASAWLVWLIAHFYAPTQRLEPFILFQFLAAPTLYLCLLNWKDSAGLLRGLRSRPAVWCFLAFLAYFGLMALPIPSEAIPPREEVLLAVAAILLAPLMFGMISQRVDASNDWVVRSICFLIAAAAAYYLWRSYGPGTGSFERRLEIKNFPFLIPLHRSISGTACFVLALILLLQSTSWKRPPVSAWWWLAIGMLPLTLYLLLSQSRSVILGAFFAALVISLAQGAWRTRLFAGLFLAFTLWFSLGNATDFLDTVTGKKVHAPSPTITVQEPKVLSETVVETKPDDGAARKSAAEGGIRGRATGGRTTIWRAYLAKAKEKPLFGHGFAGEQKIYVEVDEGLFDPQDAHLAKGTRSCHNIYISALYFGGIVGLLLMLGMVGTAWGWPLWLWWKTQDSRYLLSTAWMTMAGIALFFESTLLAHEKEAVLLWQPNDYWIFFWGSIVFSIVQTTIMKPEPREELTS